MLRYTFLSILLSILSMPLLAQLTGEIIYEEKLNLHMRIPEERAEMKEMIPEFRTEEMHLIFNEEEAVYKKYENPDAVKDEDVDMSGRGGPRIRMRGMRSNQILYQDYQNFERLEQREFFDKKFLISGEPHTFTWKLTSETKNVGDYTAHKATFSDSMRSIVAWFVPELAVPLGPGEYGQLPGLILHVDINEGERTLTATSIELRDVDAEEIIKPTKGKKMTNEEFRKMVREKMKENGMGQGGPRMHIRRRPG